MQGRGMQFYGVMHVHPANPHTCRRALSPALRCCSLPSRPRPTGSIRMRQPSTDRCVSCVKDASNEGGSWLTPLPDSSSVRNLFRRARLATRRTTKSRARLVFAWRDPRRSLRARNQWLCGGMHCRMPGKNAVTAHESCHQRENRLQRQTLLCDPRCRPFTKRAESFSHS